MKKKYRKNAYLKRILNRVPQWIPDTASLVRQDELKQDYPYSLLDIVQVAKECISWFSERPALRGRLGTESFSRGNRNASSTFTLRDKEHAQGLVGELHLLLACSQEFVHYCQTLWWTMMIGERARVRVIKSPGNSMFLHTLWQWRGKKQTDMAWPIYSALAARSSLGACSIWGLGRRHRSEGKTPSNFLSNKLCLFRSDLKGITVDHYQT